MYAKIFRQVFDSSIADDWQVRVVFQDLLILADAEGIVDMTQTAIAARTRIPLDIVNHGLNSLLTPDPHSRSKDEEGRRIIPIDPERGWGWRIVNYAKYREMKNEFDRKAYMRKYMRDNRPSRSKAEVKPRLNRSLTQSNQVKLSPSSSPSVQSSSLEEESVRGETIPLLLNTPEFRKAWAEWHEHRKEIKHKLTPRAISLQLKELEEMGPTQAVAAIECSIKNGWQGIFKPNGSQKTKQIEEHIEVKSL